jgi:archaellum component FlaC
MRDKMLKKLLNLWILIPLISSIYHVGTVYAAQAPSPLTQLVQDAQNSQTFNALVQLAVGSILTTMLLRLQRNQTKTTQEVKNVVADAAPKADFVDLQKQVKELENALALTNIQKQLVEVAQEQAETSRSLLALLTEYKGTQSTILDTMTGHTQTISGLNDSFKILLDEGSAPVQRIDETTQALLKEGSPPVQRIDNNVKTIVDQIEVVKDIAIAVADLTNTSQDAILNAFIEAVKEIKAAIQKRKTDSQPITSVELLKATAD